MSRTVTIAGQSFDVAAEHVCLIGARFAAAELERLRELDGPRSASFGDSDLDDEGLARVAELASIEALDLQGTRVSNAGLAQLARLPRLRWLRLKDNPQLTNACIPALARLATLENLQVHETSIDMVGLEGLAHLAGLADVCLEDDTVGLTFAGLTELSTRMPGCTFLVKGRGTFRSGCFSGEWDG